MQAGKEENPKPSANACCRRQAHRAQAELRGCDAAGQNATGGEGDQLQT
jgi:hypothetical protein